MLFIHWGKIREKKLSYYKVERDLVLFLLCISLFFYLIALQTCKEVTNVCEKHYLSLDSIQIINVIALTFISYCCLEAVGNCAFKVERYSSFEFFSQTVPIRVLTCSHSVILIVSS